MSGRRAAPALVLAALLAAPGHVPGQSSARWRQMNRPVEPLRIAGDLYYVGASDVAAYLVATPEGHVLIDGGFEETVPIIRAGVRKLGYRLQDVRVLLSSHAHLDHAGGLARLKELTGATLLAAAGDAPLLERGGRGDPLLGDAAPFPPVTVDVTLQDGDLVEIGGISLTARITPGHTPGCTTWILRVEDGGRTLTAVSVGSVSVLDGMRFDRDPTYPGIREDFERSFAVLRRLRPDIFLASHASFFGLARKRERLAAGEADAFIDPDGYRSFVERFERRFREALAAEREAAGVAGPREGALPR